MMWDQGTREEGEPEWAALSKELASVGADGINGDTLEAFRVAFSTASDRFAIRWCWNRRRPRLR